ncbi:ankyrin repeat domain-containing protein [Xanthomonas campestris]|uniref:ankyrin repeat domain-containing protein n=1 Tax=Xanthomonas campestris TaxID=339 RepID=UPI0005C5FDC0|nr:ankyrin repeat domain-containing protein [Xanthomonas campestris]MCC5063356.1 ankyrin repeat domain-containing protein [Xanthomonas campestris pv. raphani]MCC8486040.1 ankyrin repeat domain-containing protein [Xanthomonas campestris]MEA9650433.1 ankyrin repeat domain-containing protein [Xanthomonas campestris pv. raphani]MEA9734783.1 ankyrin repeat domain-containing protein [Xanthomonas campestris pv. raphani]MEA9743803.1 ankyrin repeat domain-containing protein [Xanthomonas campestris pv. 
MRTLLFLAWSALAMTANAASPAPVATKASAAAATPAQIKTQLQTYFFDAAREGRQDMLGEFIRSHYDLNTRDEKGYTALILAAYHGQAPAVEQLLQAGADPCAQDKRGNTALMGAIFKGELAIAKRLMQADCAPDQRNNAGQTAAMYAALFQRTDVLKDLAAKGADLSIKDAQGNEVTKLQRGEFATAPAR